MMFRHGLEYEPVFTTPSQLVLHGLNPWNQVLETVNTWSFHHQVFPSDFVSVELQHHWIDIPSSTKRKVGITKPELWWSLDARYLASSTVSPSWNGMGDCKLNQRRVFFCVLFSENLVFRLFHSLKTKHVYDRWWKTRVMNHEFWKTP